MVNAKLNLAHTVNIHKTDENEFNKILKNLATSTSLNFIIDFPHKQSNFEQKSRSTLELLKKTASINILKGSLI